MAAMKTVAELTAAEMYGLIVMANLSFVAAYYAFSAWPELETKRQKFVLLAGAFALIGFPALIGLLVFKP